jgi:hypothetical protein
MRLVEFRIPELTMCLKALLVSETSCESRLISSPDEVESKNAISCRMMEENKRVRSLEANLSADNESRTLLAKSKRKPAKPRKTAPFDSFKIVKSRLNTSPGLEEPPTALNEGRDEIKMSSRCQR